MNLMTESRPRGKEGNWQLALAKGCTDPDNPGLGLDLLHLSAAWDKEAQQFRPGRVSDRMFSDSASHWNGMLEGGPTILWGSRMDGPFLPCFLSPSTAADLISGRDRSEGGMKEEGIFPHSLPTCGRTSLDLPNSIL